MRNRINAEEREHAICAYYLHQYCGNYESVTNCAKSGHPLWPYRLGGCVKRDPSLARQPDPCTGKDYRVDPPLTRGKAIHAACLLCCGSTPEVQRCDYLKCALWPYRMEKFGKGALCAGTDDERSIDHE